MEWNALRRGCRDFGGGRCERARACPGAGHASIDRRRIAWIERSATNPEVCERVGARHCLRSSGIHRGAISTKVCERTGARHGLCLCRNGISRSAIST